MMQVTENQNGDFTDVLIIGAGIAGLTTAIKLAMQFPHGRITLLSKDKPGESNTRYAQGGIAAVINTIEDSFDLHLQDTLNAGDGLCRREVVEAVVREGPERLREIIELGARFDCDSSGELALGLEGGHSAHRIVHAKDRTGSAIICTLMSKLASLKNVTTVWSALAFDLLTGAREGQNVCSGITYISTNNELRKIQARFTVLATGGIGQVYPFTTNPAIATGDGIAMAYRAGADIANMAFVQFHPTALNVPANGGAFLISEALRGFGARLVTASGKRFMFSYDKRGELAPRDIVARAVYTESRDNQVFLDCRHLPPASLKQNFPKIYASCLACGIDITLEKIPVAPAAHYLCGGITTDMNARTSIGNLYAVGECACTGLHGANRLASNSLIEALVFAHRCSIDIGHKLRWQKFISEKSTITTAGNKSITDSELLSIQNKMRLCMANSAGIVRSTESLHQGLGEVLELKHRVEYMVKVSKPNWVLYETRNLLTVAMLILQQSFEQKQNKGAHYNLDLDMVDRKRKPATVL